jgi:hypothetical protein
MRLSFWLSFPCRSLAEDLTLLNYLSFSYRFRLSVSIYFYICLNSSSFSSSYCLISSSCLSLSEATYYSFCSSSATRSLSSSKCSGRLVRSDLLSLRAGDSCCRSDC